MVAGRQTVRPDEHHGERDRTLGRRQRHRPAAPVGHEDQCRVRRAVPVAADSKTLLCQTVVADRGPAARRPKVPAGPTVQESTGKAAPVRTFQDLLKNPHDEDLFDYYATSQLASGRSPATGKLTPLGKPRHLRHGRAVTRTAATSSWSPSTGPTRTCTPPRLSEGSRGLGPRRQDGPQARQPAARRSGAHRGRADRAARLPVATDRAGHARLGRGPRRRRPEEEGRPPRPRAMLTAPFSGRAVRLAKTEHRFAGLTWGEKDALALLRDYDRDRRWVRTFLLNADPPRAHAGLGSLRPGPLQGPRQSADARLPDGGPSCGSSGDAHLPGRPGRDPARATAVPRPLQPDTSKAERLFRSGREELRAPWPPCSPTTARGSSRITSRRPSRRTTSPLRVRDGSRRP